MMLGHKTKLGKLPGSITNPNLRGKYPLTLAVNVPKLILQGVHITFSLTREGISSP